MGGGSDSELAIKVGVTTRQTISNWKKGEGLNLKKLEEVAKTYNKSLKWLLFGEESMIRELLDQDDDLLDASGLYDRIKIAVGESSERRVSAQIIEALGFDAEKFTKHKKQLFQQWQKGVPAAPFILMRIGAANGINPSWIVTGKGQIRLTRRVPIGSTGYSWIAEASRASAEMAEEHSRQIIEEAVARRGKPLENERIPIIDGEYAPERLKRAEEGIEKDEEREHSERADDANTHTT